MTVAPGGTFRAIFVPQNGSPTAVTSPLVELVNASNAFNVVADSGGLGGVTLTNSGAPNHEYFAEVTIPTSAVVGHQYFLRFTGTVSGTEYKSIACVTIGTDLNNISTQVQNVFAMAASGCCS